MKKFLLGCLVVILLLAACGPTAEETPSAVAPTEAQAEAPSPTEVPTEPAAEVERVTVRFAVLDVLQPIYEDKIKAFEEENPDVQVEIVSIDEVLGLGALADIEFPDDADQRLVAAADVVGIGVSRDVVQAGLVRDLTPFIEADPNFDPDDFYADALASRQWDGGTWALPTTLNTRLIFYDRDAFDEAGVPYPEAGWSWDDLLVKAKALTAGAGDEVTRWGFVPNWSAYRLVESRVGTLADYAADPPMPRFDEDDVVEGVRWYTDLYLKEQVMPYFEPEEGEEPLVSKEQALVDKGQAAMWADTDILWWLRKQAGNIGVAPFPADMPDVATTPASVDHVAMSAGTAQPKAAWRWMEFLSQQPLSGLTLGLRFLPARPSAAETNGYWDDLDEEFAAALRYAVDHSYVMREAVGYDAFDAAVHAIFQGEKAVEDALVDAQTEAEAEIQTAMAEQAGATPVPTFAVAPAEGEKPVSEGAVTISFIPGLGSLNMEPYRDLAEQFHEENPDVVVEVKMLDLLSGTTPDLPNMAETSDCFQWYPSFQEAKNREAILNLAPFLDADPSFTTDDYFPQVLEQFTWQGQLWGLPADVTPFIIEYNRDLFDAAGLDYPSVDWTPDDFLTLAVALTQGEDADTKQYGFVGEYYALNDLLFMVERLGAKLVDQDADPPALSYDDPDTVEAVRWYANLTTEHGAKPAFLTDITKLAGAGSALAEREGLINTGRAAMWTASGATAALLGGREGINIGAAPLPTRPGTSVGGFSGASGYFISSSTENPLACWQWITYLTVQPGAVQGLPARRSVAESNQYRQQVGADRADAYVASIGEAGEPSSFQIFSEEEWLGGALFWLGQAYGQVIDGEASVEEALAVAQQMADDYRACVVAAGDFGEETWQACVREIDPTLPGLLFGASE